MVSEKSIRRRQPLDEIFPTEDKEHVKPKSQPKKRILEKTPRIPPVIPTHLFTPWYFFGTVSLKVVGMASMNRS